jgi:hypothetical protein
MNKALEIRRMFSYCSNRSFKPARDPSMSTLTSFPQAILDTTLLVLAPLFLAVTGGDLAAARLAAVGVLDDYNAATQEELRLAGEIVTFSLKALQALAESSEPDIPISRVMRLRGNAVSLRRVANQSQRKLDQLQRARLAAAPAVETTATDADPAPIEPVVASAQTPMDRALTLLESTRDAIKTGNTPATRRWSRAAQKHAMALQMAETSRRKKAEYERQQAELITASPLPNSLQTAQ